MTNRILSRLIGATTAFNRGTHFCGFDTDEANLIDLIKSGRGNLFSLKQFEEEFSTLNLVNRYRSFKVPIFFLLGRHD